VRIPFSSELKNICNTVRCWICFRIYD